MAKPLADPEVVRQERLRARAAKQERELALMTHAARVYASDSPRSFRNAPKRGAMNKSEQLHSEHLDRLQAIGTVIEWRHGAISLRLADRTWYRPDFLVSMETGRLEIHEVKG